MATTLVLTFPFGRYHATPWGRQVNEGAVEVPPSPWRLLRALYAVWRTRAPELSAETVHALLGRLAEPPTFHLPRHGVAHTRHYYPDSKHTSGKASTDRTLDAFAVFERDADLAAVWPFDLDADAHAALVRLAGSIPYFGRADSVCTGAVPEDWVPAAHDTWVPLDTAESVPEGATATAVLAPELPLRLDSVVARPVDVRRGGLLFPAGTRLVGYQRTKPALRPRPRRVGPQRSVEAVRFSVLQAGLPPRGDALVYTDLLRQAALSRRGGTPDERDRSVLGGRNADGSKMLGHGHAHYLPLIVDRRLTGLLVWAPAGLDERELKALTGVTSLYSRVNDAWRLSVRVAGIGTVAQVAPEIATPATQWRTVTPFTPARYPKRGRDWATFLGDEVGRELASRERPAPCEVTPDDGDWREFRRYRPSAQRRRDPRQGQVTRPSAFLRVRFDEPVTGPLALGHLSHFGLGLLAPDQG